MNKASEKGGSRWLLAAMAAPVTQAASNCSWPVALSIGALCLGITYGLEKYGVRTAQTRLLGAIQWLWMLLLISEFLHWTMLCWPNHKSYHVVPLTILALAAYSSAKGKEKTARVGAVLFWLLTFLLGAVLLSGVKEIELDNIRPQWKIQTAQLIVVMLIPAMGIGLGKSKSKITIVAYAVLTALVTSGVMSLGLIERMRAPFYEMSRSLSLLGVGQRFESLVAAGLTLGYFALMTYLLTIMATAWEKGRRMNRSVWISALFAGLVFLSGMRMNSRLLALGTVAVWTVFPLIEKTVKLIRFPLDKPETK